MNKDEDFLDMVRSGAQGTVADFSGFEGVKAGGNFMPIKTKEEVKKIIEEEIKEEEIKEEEIVKEEEPQKMDKPGTIMEGYMNPKDLMDVAIKLMPTVGAEKISEEVMLSVSENAIKLAFTFLNTFNKIVNIEGA